MKIVPETKTSTSQTERLSNFAVYPSLKDRVVFVTGGASGIGKSIVEHFCAQKARVAFVDIAEGAGKSLAAQLKEQHRTDVVFKAVDLNDITSLKRSITQAAEELG